jgi:hypothetical protein
MRTKAPPDNTEEKQVDTSFSPHKSSAFAKRPPQEQAGELSDAGGAKNSDSFDSIEMIRYESSL